MQIIGLAGGVACGKSLVGEQFARLGAEVFRADDEVHQLLRQPDIVTAVIDRWGEQVLRADGQVDRAAVGRLVFADTEAARADRQWLEKLVHPRVTDRLDHHLERLAARGDCLAVVIDAPLLFEAGWADRCNQIVFIETPYEQRLERVRLRGWTDEQLAARENAQWPVANKRIRADLVIDNSGTEQETFDQVKKLWRRLCGDGPTDAREPKGLS